MPVDILAFGAHPDDVEIGAAGLLLRAKPLGRTTGLVILTKGEAGTFGDIPDREAEARAAAEILGVDYFLQMDYPDAKLEPTYEIALELARILKEQRPTLVLAPAGGDRHPDHNACSALVDRARFLAQRTRVLPELPALPRPRLLLFALDIGRPRVPDLVLDITEVYHTKQQALQAHSSQYTPILFAVEIAARYYGAMINVAYGEGFIVAEPLAVGPDLHLI